MTAYPFLSDDWIAAVEKLQSQYKDQLPPPPVAVKLNLVVTDLPTPFQSTKANNGALEGHINTEDGQLLVNLGHLENPEITVTTDYETAKATFVTRDQQEVMAAFLSGKVLVEGDASKLLALQAPPSDSDEASIANKIYAEMQAFTEK